MINTIIVPTDGSGHANRAVELAGDIAARFGARVVIVQTLLHHNSATELKRLCEELKVDDVDDEVVAKIDELQNAMFEVAAADYAPVPVSVPPDILRRIGERIADRARQTIEWKGVKEVSTQVVDGKPADNIIAAAKHEKADLIVMGRRGLGDVAGMLMGSVSHKVTHLAECACLTVK